MENYWINWPNHRKKLKMISNLSLPKVTNELKKQIKNMTMLKKIYKKKRNLRILKNQTKLKNKINPRNLTNLKILKIQKHQKNRRLSKLKK